MSSLLCMIKGHTYAQCLPIKVPARFTHAMYCLRCGNTLFFVDPPPCNSDLPPAAPNCGDADAVVAARKEESKGKSHD